MQYDESSDKEQERAIVRELASLKARRVLRTLAVVQDIADALLTLPDLGGESLHCSIRFAILLVLAIPLLWCIPCCEQG